MKKTFHSTWAAWPWHVLALTLFLSCSDRSSVAPAVESYTLEREILDTAKTLKPETVNFDSPITAENVYVWNDSIAVVKNIEDQKEHKLLEIYNINNGSLLWDAFVKGNGPGEILICNAYLRNDSILIDDFSRYRFTVFPITAPLSNPDFMPELTPYSIQTQALWPYRGRLLALNPHCFTNGQLGIDYDRNRFIVSDSSYNYKDHKTYEYDTHNLTAGNLSISYKNDRIVYASSLQPVIEIFDTDLNLLKRISGPELPHKTEYAAYNNALFHKNEAPNTYTCQCSNSEFIYLSFIGDFTSRDKKYDDLDTWLFKFDWNGNFIDSYHIGHPIKSMSLSADGNSIYIFGSNDEGNNALYKYTLP